jgi:hypothetical protein
MARPKGYDYQKRYREAIWNLIPASKPGARRTDIYREARKQIPTLSKGTLSAYFGQLPIIREHGLYRRDPQITNEDDPYGLQKFRGQSRGFDPWNDLTYEFDSINPLFNLALRHYIETVNRLLRIHDKQKAHEVFSLHLEYRLGPLLEDAAATAWRYRKKITKSGSLSLRVDRELLAGSIV